MSQGIFFIINQLFGENERDHEVHAKLRATDAIQYLLENGFEEAPKLEPPYAFYMQRLVEDHGMQMVLLYDEEGDWRGANAIYKGEFGDITTEMPEITVESIKNLLHRCATAHSFLDPKSDWRA